MADIPVEERKKTHWWAWILGLLVVGGVIWAIVAIPGEEEPVAEAPIEDPADPEPVEPPGGATVMDLTTVTTASTTSSFFGREVQLNNLYVTDVVSDKVFYVCSAEVGTPGQPAGQSGTGGEDPCTTEKVLVVLEENPGAGPSPPPGTDVEGAVNVNPGQMLTIQTGWVNEFVQNDAEDWGLQEEEMDQIAQEEFYIGAAGVNITAEGGSA